MKQNESKLQNYINFHKSLGKRNQNEMKLNEMKQNSKTRSISTKISERETKTK